MTKPKGNVQNLKHFKPGQSGNPGGRPKTPQDIRDAKAADRTEFERTLHKYMHMPIEVIELRLSDPQTPAIEQITGKIIIEAASRGDHMRFDFLLNRLIGKVPDKLEASGDLSIQSLVVSIVSDHES